MLVAVASLLPAASPAGAAPALAPVVEAPAGPSPADPVSEEAAFVADINALRAGLGVPALEVHPNLVDKARGWAATMAAAGRIWHSTVPDGITADWAKLGENVGMGGSETGLHAAFVASPHHYDNLIDPAFTYVGVGVVHAGAIVFVSEVFMKLAPAAPPAATPAPRPPATIPPTASVPAPIPAPRPALTPVALRSPGPATGPAPAIVAPVPAELSAAPTVAPSLLLRSVLERLHAWDT
jgi:hypothetical protein